MNLNTNATEHQILIRRDISFNLGVNESFISLTSCAWHDIGGFDDKYDDQLMPNRFRGQILMQL